MSNIVTTNVSDVPIKDKQLLIDPENGELYFDHGGTRVKLGGSEAPVSSVNGKTGEVVLEAADVGATPVTEYVDWDWEVDGDPAGGISLHSGKYYDIGDLTDLVVEEVETSLREIVIKFRLDDAGNNIISFPASLAWINEPDFAAGKTYIISIVNNIAVAGEVTV